MPGMAVPVPPAGNIADDRGHAPVGQEPLGLLPDGGGGGGVVAAGSMSGVVSVFAAFVIDKTFSTFEPPFAALTQDAKDAKKNKSLFSM